jgi:hypothetical protein
MRYNLLFVVPYVVVIVLFVFSTYVLQGDQHKIEVLTTQNCSAQRSMYAVISQGLRRRAKIELNIPLPPIEGNAKKKRADALTVEADEMDHTARTLPNCKNN